MSTVDEIMDQTTTTQEPKPTTPEPTTPQPNTTKTRSRDNGSNTNQRQPRATTNPKDTTRSRQQSVRFQNPPRSYADAAGKVTSEKPQSKEQSSALSALLNKLDTKLDVHTRYSKSLRARIDQVESTTKLAETTANSRMDHLTTQMTKLEHKVDNQPTIPNSTTSPPDIQPHVTNLLAEMKALQEANLSEWQKQQAAYQSQLEVQRVEHQSRLEQLQTRLGHLETQHAETQDTAVSARKQLRNLTQTVTQNSSDVRQLNERSINNSSRIGTLDSQMTRQEKKAKQLDAQQYKLEKEMKEVDNKHQDQTAMIERLEAQANRNLEHQESALLRSQTQTRQTDNLLRILITQPNQFTNINRQITTTTTSPSTALTIITPRTTTTARPHQEITPATDASEVTPQPPNNEDEAETSPPQAKRQCTIPENNEFESPDETRVFDRFIAEYAEREINPSTTTNSNSPIHNHNNPTPNTNSPITREPTINPTTQLNEPENSEPEEIEPNVESDAESEAESTADTISVEDTNETPRHNRTTTNPEETRTEPHQPPRQPDVEEYPNLDNEID